MKTDVIKIYSDLSGHEAAMEAAEKFSNYNNISGKSALHIRLLTEETISMVHGIFDGFEGKLWLESEKTEKGRICRICISVPKTADVEQELQLMDISSSGKNQSAKGFMGKIREVVRLTIQPPPQKPLNSKVELADVWWNRGSGSSLSENTSAAVWSLQKYRENSAADGETASEEWDELEKSIVAKLSDDVKVWLKSSSTDVVIEKLIPSEE